MGFWQAAALVAATVSVGLTAGLLFAFACAVMPGLARLDDRAFVAAFQAIDRAIINPLFLAVFTGAVVLPAGAVALHLGADQRSVLPWTLAALVFSLATVVITRAVHLPLNARIQAAGEPDRIADPGRGTRQVRDSLGAPIQTVHEPLTLCLGLSGF